MNGFVTAHGQSTVHTTEREQSRPAGETIRAEELHSEIKESIILSAGLSAGLKYEIRCAESENGAVQAVFMQDNFMKKIFSRYPEIVLVDVVPGVNVRGFHLCILRVLDGVGDDNIVGLFLVASREEVTFEAALKAFKDENPKWKDARLCLMRRDSLPRIVLRNELPQLSFFFWPTEVVHIFEKDITEEMAGTTRGRDRTMTILREMAFTHSKYQDLYEQLIDLDLKLVDTYFDNKWHNIKREWVKGFHQLDCFTPKKFHHTITKLKNGLVQSVTFPNFFVTLFRTILPLRDKKCAGPSGKVFSQATSMDMFSDLLTSYALKIVCAQYNSSRNVILREHCLGFKCFDGTYAIEMTTADCSCHFWRLLQLPCKHILAARRVTEVELFDPLLVVPRWSKSYYQQSVKEADDCTRFNNLATVPNGGLESSIGSKDLKNLTQKKMINCELQTEPEQPRAQSFSLNKNFPVPRQIDKVVTDAMPTVNGTTHKAEDPPPPSTEQPDDKKHTTDLKAASKSSSIELFNFGTAPLEVIERFQEFCYDYPTLTDAINGLLGRGSFLKNKYRFKQSMVTYQMLAEPTTDDWAVALQKAMSELQRFTRTGKYESVANAIEELLYSPALENSYSQATWTCGNVGTSYTELDCQEQLLLEKIADALLNRLTTALPRKRHYKRRDPEAKRKKTVGDKPVASSKMPSPDSSFESTVKQGDVVKTPGSYLSLKSSASFDVPSIDESQTIIDEEVAIPLKNFLKPNRTNFKPCKPDLSPFMKNAKSPSKSQFYELFLDLMPDQVTE